MAFVSINTEVSGMTDAATTSQSLGGARARTVHFKEAAISVAVALRPCPM